MLEIIAWLALVMFATKIFELWFSPTHRGADGELQSGVGAIILVGLLAIVVFAILLGTQHNSMASAFQSAGAMP